MKYLVLIPDGAADAAVPALGGKSPLQAAKKPHLDRLARGGTMGLVRTVPAGMDPGSDVANLSLFGYDPVRYYTGRAPLEAASLGVQLQDGEIAFRCNLVSTGGLPPTDPAAVMEDYSAGHISTAESRRVIDDFLGSGIYRSLFLPDLSLYPGVGYRHLLVWLCGPDRVRLTPPHDILGERLEPYLPAGLGGKRLRELMEASFGFLSGHPVNRERRERGLPTADSFWFWGAGRRPALPLFRECHGLSGAVISAVDLVNGIGVLAGLERVSVPGATGYLDTNYDGKARHALTALRRHDLVFVHIEAPDEAGHQGDPQLKVQAIEDLDRKFLGVVLEGLEAVGGFRVLVAPDHPTPVATRTHAADPVPFVIFPAPAADQGSAGAFDEEWGRRAGHMIEEGHRLLGRFIGEH